MRENTALIVDDDISARTILSCMLDRIGCDSIAANDGIDALSRVENTDVSVVLCDWDMPGLSGIDVCTRLREQAEGRYIYFILVSARTERESVFEGLEAGADDFICKPVDINELAVKIKSAFRVINLERQLEEKNRRLQLAYSTVTDDLLMAGEIQQSLLPAPYSDGSIETGWLFKPAQYVSGDMFDYFMIEERYWAFFVMDVEGHGIPSALTVFSINNQLTPAADGLCASMIRQKASLADACVATVTELNKHCRQGRYFTMVYGVVDLKTGEVTMTQAGHPCPLHLSHVGGTVNDVGNGGMPVGLLEDASFTASSFTLQAGDRLVIYSDGGPECPDTEGQLYGREQLAQLVLHHRDSSVAELCDKFEQSLCRWNGDKAFDDDVSLLAIEFHGVKK